MRLSDCIGGSDTFDTWELFATPRVASDGKGPVAGGKQTANPRIDIFANGERGYRVFRIPALVRANSTILAFAEARMNGADHDHIDLVVKRSTDEGRTWGRMITVAGNKDEPGLVDHGNPAPVYDEHTGKVMLVWCYNNMRVFISSSLDEGQTWSKPHDITHMVKRPGWGWMATGPGHAMQLRSGFHSGRIVVPFNTFFEASEVKTIVRQRGCAHTEECALYYDKKHKSLETTIEITNPLDPNMPPLRASFNNTTHVPEFVWAGNRAGVFFSDDHGETWRIGGMINSRLGSSECVAAETERGLLLSFRVEDADTKCRKMALSQDGGATFEPFFEPSVCIPDPVCQGSVLQLEDGRLLTSGPGTAESRSNMTLFIADAPRAGRHGAESEPFRFRKLDLVAKGVGGYSDIVELAPAHATGGPRVGVAWELGWGGGVVWKNVELPQPGESREAGDPRRGGWGGRRAGTLSDSEDTQATLV